MQDDEEPTDLWSGLPVGARERTVELEWPALDGTLKEAARLIQVTLLAWDPLERLPGRPPWFAVAGGAREPEVRLYVNAVPVATPTDGGSDHLVARLAAQTATAAAEHLSEVTSGRYPWAEARGRAPSLLGRDLPPDHFRIRPARGHLGEWRAMSRRSMEDVVQHHHGPVRLDHSLMELTQGQVTDASCPACAKPSLGFPEETERVLLTLCPQHASEARDEVQRRTAQAQRSNPTAWTAAEQAERCAEQPHLPASMAPLLAAAAAKQWPGGSPEEQGATVLDALARLPHADAVQALGFWPANAQRWLHKLPQRLERAGDHMAAAALAAALWPPDGLAPVTETKKERAEGRALGRNSRCPCGSGLKVKYCHGRQADRTQGRRAS